jgi:TolB-like protein/Tfp pilus assembly protein PilF
MIGRTLAHYRIASAIGAGGMGEVYRAIDTKLGRAVALKVLPPAMARDPERLARFEREARAVAALNHPHIVTLYSVEEGDGITFLTMELVEGDSLAAGIPEGGLPLDRILTIGAALADALAAAHAKGIVHRDLKPANVMLTDEGRIKVLDFGLAKNLRPSDRPDMTVTSAGHTEVGMVMGTPAYMSPEQLAGRPVDHRTDIFSLGILLYQMASGQRPFEGRTSIELASAILRDTPRPLEDVRPDLPAELSRLVQRCLEKDRERRVPTARDLASALGDIGRHASSASRGGTGADSGEGRRVEGFWIAVLPFKHSGGSTDIAALAEDLWEGTVRGLSRFSYLRVIARSSTSKYASGSRDVGPIGEEVGARYVLDGSVRQAGSTIRVAVQLVDAATGAHLWADTYDRQFTPDQLFALQDEVVPRIVSTCGDHFGVLARSISETVRGKTAGQLTPYDALMRGFGYHHRLTPDEHAAARDVLERAVEAAPSNADCWAMLSWIYSHEFGHGFNPRPGSLDRALTAARRAVDLAPSNPLAQQTLAVALFFRKDHAACLSACERALALNPLDASNEAMFLIAFMGDWERGSALIRRAMERNPHHPGWFRLMFGFEEYRAANYRAAIEEIAKANVPDFFWSSVLAAAAHGQLGESRAARSALDDLLAQKPEFAQSAEELIGRWFDPRSVEHFMDGLRKAGLEGLPDDVPLPAVDPHFRNVSRAPFIAVLPFANMSAEQDQDYFSDGLADEIISLLGHIDGLRVIARTSSFAFRGKEQDVRRIAESLGVTHVLEGSVRRAGGRIRVTAQLIAATDGGHVWSDRYDREPSDIFAVQDEISAAITKALRLRLSAGEKQRYVPKLPAYEAYLRAKHHQARVTPEAWDLAKACYESAVELDPAFALAHVGLGFYWLGLAHFGRCPAHEAVPRARAAAQRALGLDGSLPDAHALLGLLAAQYDLNWDAAERHFDVPMARLVGYSLVRPIYGGFLFLKGDLARAIEIAERAIAEDPLEVWPRMNLHAYLQAAGRDHEAYEQALKVLELDPNLVVARVSIAHFHAAWGQLSEAVTAARKAHDVGQWYQDARATLAALLRVSGAEDEAKALQRSLGSGEGFGDCRAHALYHLLSGDVDTGADWTEKSIAERDFSMMYYLRFVVCRPLQASARWPTIARMVNLPDWRA